MSEEKKPVVLIPDEQLKKDLEKARALINRRLIEMGLKPRNK